MSFEGFMEGSSQAASPYKASEADYAHNSTSQSI